MSVYNFIFLAIVQWKQKMGWRRMNIATVALCRAVAATPVQRRVWMQSRSQEWWGRGTNGFGETDFILVQHDKGYFWPK